MPMTPPPELDYGDVQGLVRFGHGRLEDACYLLVDVADAAAARTWLRHAPVTTAVTMTPPPDTALQIAFTSKGLRRLGVPETAIAQFSDEFITGMAGEPSRSRRLGDVGADAPAGWDWGGSEAGLPDLVVMLFARKGDLASWEQACAGPDWSRAFTLRLRLLTNDIGDIEPFGFADGVSQPRIDWAFELELVGRERLEFGNVMALG